jgi:hypothetical protein
VTLGELLQGRHRQHGLLVCLGPTLTIAIAHKPTFERISSVLHLDRCDRIRGTRMPDPIPTPMCCAEHRMVPHRTFECAAPLKARNDFRPLKGKSTLPSRSSCQKRRLLNHSSGLRLGFTVSGSVACGSGQRPWVLVCSARQEDLRTFNSVRTVRSREAHPNFFERHL